MNCLGAPGGRCSSCVAGGARILQLAPEDEGAPERIARIVGGEDRGGEARNEFLAQKVANVVGYCFGVSVGFGHQCDVPCACEYIVLGPFGP